MASLWPRNDPVGICRRVYARSWLEITFQPDALSLARAVSKQKVATDDRSDGT